MSHHPDLPLDRQRVAQPSAQPLISHFVKKFIDEWDTPAHVARTIDEACILVNNATDTEWFQSLLEHSTATLFLRGRVKFLDPRGNPGAPLQGQLLLYYGHQIDVFSTLFHNLGGITPTSLPGKPNEL